MIWDYVWRKSMRTYLKAFIIATVITSIIVAFGVVAYKNAQKVAEVEDPVADFKVSKISKTLNLKKYHKKRRVSREHAEDVKRQVDDKDKSDNKQDKDKEKDQDKPKPQDKDSKTDKKDNKDKQDEKDKKEKPKGPSLSSLVERSRRLNILLLGIDGERADVILLLSYDQNRHKADFITVPRDTYNVVKGYPRADQKKINAVYGFRRSKGGAAGMKREVSKLLGVPIDFYAVTTYDSIKQIVNAVGGVELEIERDMHYDDEYSNPPLHIDFDKGYAHLNGQKAVEYLRWRKNNHLGGGGDLPRTKRQMKFIKSFTAKVFTTFDFLDVVSEIYDAVETDMPINTALYYAKTLVGFDPEQDISHYTIPGVSKFKKLSYYFRSKKRTEKMMIGIYKKGLETKQSKEEEW